MRTGFAALTLVLCSAGTWAQVYKCPDASGRLSLQQTPCAGGAKLDVRPASGLAPSPNAVPEAAAAAPAAAAPAAKKTYTDQLAEEREQRERWQRLNNARLAVDRERRVCEREQQEFASQKRLSNNNLAGAARDSAISGEMQAAATMCLGRLRGLEGEVSRAEAECARAGCRQPGT